MSNLAMKGFITLKNSIIPGDNFLYILEFSMPVLLKTKVIVAYSGIRCRS